MFAKGIASKTRHSLALLSQINLLKQFYLAGGTAIALHLGHRLSFDLDFFTRKDFSQKELMNLMNKKGKFKLEEIHKNTLLGIFEETKVSFFKYNYPLIGRIDFFDNIKIANVKDLMAMKVDAISTRSKKRDFIDLYFLCQKQSLAKAIDFYKQKYENQNINIFHSLKALNYFLDAEEDENEIKMLVSHDWEKVKEYFLIEVPKVLDKEVKKLGKK